MVCLPLAVTAHFCLTRASKIWLVGTDWSTIWRWSERHLTIFCIDEIVPSYVVMPLNSEYAGGVAFPVQVSCCVSGSHNGKKCKKYPISSKNITPFFLVKSQCLFCIYFLLQPWFLQFLIFILILKIVVAFPFPVHQKVAKNTRFCRKIWLFFLVKSQCQGCTLKSFNIFFCHFFHNLFPPHLQKSCGIYFHFRSAKK